METGLLKVKIRYEHDVVLARQRARLITHTLGFDAQDQVRIATAVSELTRNAFQYAGGGRIDFLLSDGDRQRLVIRVSDEGPGISNLSEILNGRYVSRTGMGLGLVGARRLMDDFSITSEVGKGTQVELTKYLPKRAPAITPALIAKLTQALHQQEAQSPFEEISKQNQELLAALDEVHRQQKLLTQLNQELEETNRGVMALSSELEQRADYQRRASELKTEFLSGITHELRTPLNSIISLSGMLLDRLDGELSEEQEKQVAFIQSSAKSLSEIVNDVLDIAKVEAGKITIRPSEFSISEMFRILRGMLKPLVQKGDSVTLLFEDAEKLPVLFTDEGKVSQILRNFISNSLKYTPSGEVRVFACMTDAQTIKFSVTDTGIGIKESNYQLIFEEFSQVEGEHQQKVRGTGLGLPLTRKLARMLGGEVQMESTLGKGSTFSLIIPIAYSGPQDAQYSEPYAAQAQERWERILIVDDNPTDRYVLKKMLETHADEIIEASSGEEGLSLVSTVHPAIIFLDLAMPEMSGYDVLEKLEQADNAGRIPIVIHTSSVLSEEDKMQLLTRVTAILPKSSSQKSRMKELSFILQGIMRSEQQSRSMTHA